MIAEFDCGKISEYSDQNVNLSKELCGSSDSGVRTKSKAGLSTWSCQDDDFCKMIIDAIVAQMQMLRLMSS